MKILIILLSIAAFFIFMRYRAKNNLNNALQLLEQWKGWVNFISYEDVVLFSGKIVGKTPNFEVMALGYMEKSNIPEELCQVLESLRGSVPDIIPAKCISNLQQDTILSQLEEPAAVAQIETLIQAEDVQYEYIMVDSNGITHIDNPENLAAFNKTWSASVGKNDSP